MPYRLANGRVFHVPTHNDHPANAAKVSVRTVLLSIVGVVLFGAGVAMLAVPGLLPFGGHSADGTTIRNVLYGIFLVVAGLLLFVYGVLSHRRKVQAARQTAGVGGDGGAASPGAAGSELTADGTKDVTTVTDLAERTVTQAGAEAAEMGGVVVGDTRIIQVARATLDKNLRTSFGEGCTWLDVDEMAESALPIALLIPTRGELFDYLANHFPAQTVMMSDHLAKGSGLPYFVNGGVHLHCAMVKNPKDMSRMISTYNPKYPLACALVSGAMNLDSRASEAKQMQTIRESVIGLVCWHAERGEFILVCGEN